MAAHMHEIPELDKAGYRNFALIWGGIVAGIFGVLFPFVIGSPFMGWNMYWPWVVLGVCAVWGLVAPMTLKPFYNGWMKFGNFMGGRIMTPLIMFLVFAGMFVPMGLVIRLFGKDLLSMKLEQAADTYRVISNKPPAKNLEKPF